MSSGVSECDDLRTWFPRDFRAILLATSVSLGKRMNQRAKGVPLTEHRYTLVILDISIIQTTHSHSRTVHNQLELIAYSTIQQKHELSESP
jgi:hypothetical protein